MRESFYTTTFLFSREMNSWRVGEYEIVIYVCVCVHYYSQH